jgi:cytoskeletal protein RodZ
MSDYPNDRSVARRGRNTWNWIGAIVVLVLIVGAIWWAVDRRGNDATTAGNTGATSTTSTAQSPAPAPSTR